MTSGNTYPDPIDNIFAVMLKEEQCYAMCVLRKLLKDWEIYQLGVRFDSDARTIAIVEGVDKVRCFANLYAELQSIATEQGDDCQAINSGHLLIYMLRATRHTPSNIASLYGLDSEKVAAILTTLPADEDDYAASVRNSSINTIRIESHFCDFDSGRAERLGELSSSNGYRAESNGQTDKLEEYGTDLSRAAREGRIDPVVGRDNEIERLIQILGRRKKNNPVLIGEAGVGKSAIVEGLALRIVSREVPASLIGKTIFSLDVTLLVAGTKYRGEFEERIKGLIEQIDKRRNLILFIDEIHTIVGAGATQGSLDTANILKPALARGELQCIGATTLDEYRENIERDSALERRFQKIVVRPATRNQTVEILHNLKPRYEQFHEVRFTDEAVAACVDLADRYITDRNFPDKAIDLLDEAGSAANTVRNLKQTTTDADDCAKDRLSVEHVSNSGTIQSKPLTESPLNRAALCQTVERTDDTKPTDRLSLRREVTVDDVQRVVSVMTGIPVGRLNSDRRQRLMQMQQQLASRVVGQTDAIEKVVRSMMRQSVGLSDSSKPIGVFMFAGPSGVGKTLLAKEIARQLFDSEESLVRLDMSEYSERFNISRLIGSPPGYVGYNEGGKLTEAVRRRPYSVVLFDEIEKAHPDLFNLMLQIMDDGELTDGLGRKVDFRNTVIIMTSNAGSRNRSVATKVGYTATDTSLHIDSESSYRKALEKLFAPEFLNRIDDVALFNSLSDKDTERIVELEIEALNARAAKSGLTVSITEQAKRQLATSGYSPMYGVRQLKRVLAEQVEWQMARLIVDEKITAGDRVDICLREGKVVLLAA